MWPDPSSKSNWPGKNWPTDKIFTPPSPSIRWVSSIHSRVCMWYSSFCGLQIPVKLRRASTIYLLPLFFRLFSCDTYVHACGINTYHTENTRILVLVWYPSYLLWWSSSYCHCSGHQPSSNNWKREDVDHTHSSKFTEKASTATWNSPGFEDRAMGVLTGNREHLCDVAVHPLRQHSGSGNSECDCDHGGTRSRRSSSRSSISRSTSSSSRSSSHHDRVRSGYAMGRWPDQENHPNVVVDVAVFLLLVMW